MKSTASKKINKSHNGNNEYTYHKKKLKQKRMDAMPPSIIQQTEYVLTDDDFSGLERLERDFLAYVKLADTLRKQLEAVDATIQEIRINYQAALGESHH